MSQWALGGLILVGVLLIALGTPTPQQKQWQAERVAAQESWNAAAVSKLQEKCKKTVDATGLFYEQFQEAFARGFRTRSAARDLVAWDCPNGTRYWSTNDAVPTGFIRDYAKELPALHASR